MKPYCYCCPDKKAVYPKNSNDGPIYCSMRCAAEDAVSMRYDSTPLETSVLWCDVCENWIDHVLDGCDICDQTLQCQKCNDYFSPRDGCCGEPPITRENRKRYGWEGPEKPKRRSRVKMP